MIIAEVHMDVFARILLDSTDSVKALGICRKIMFQRLTAHSETLNRVA
jgi:hypothetical protein